MKWIFSRVVLKLPINITTETGRSQEERWWQDHIVNTIKTVFQLELISYLHRLEITTSGLQNISLPLPELRKACSWLGHRIPNSAANDSRYFQHNPAIVNSWELEPQLLDISGYFPVRFQYPWTNKQPPNVSEHLGHPKLYSVNLPLIKLQPSAEIPTRGLDQQWHTAQVRVTWGHGGG